MDTRSKQEMFRGVVALAPLTKGGNLPYRRLVTELGARTTYSEMAVARDVVRGKRSELALLRKADDEICFGVQLADRMPEQAADAAKIAVERGADFIDLNLGCPIDLICKRGLGSSLMRKPNKVAAIVESIRNAVDVPVTIKMRLGYEDAKPRYMEVARAAVDAGVDAITLHGRSRTQRYRRAADWSHVARLVEAVDVPVIGNGDILSWRDAERVQTETGCAGLMLGRGALMKPWLFREIAEKRDYLLSADQRLDLLRRYRSLALAHFYADERGRRRVEQFLEWHLDFFSRYRPVSSDNFDPENHPLIQTRDQPAEFEDTPQGWLDSRDSQHHAKLAAYLIEEIDKDPESVERWSAQTAGSILDGN